MARVGEITLAISANRYLILLLLFMAACASYAVGFSAGVGLFIGIGIVFEGIFWIELFARRRRR